MEGVAHFHWHKWAGDLPAGTVYASDTYVVCRALHNHEWMPGKLHVTDKRVFVAWGGKEIQVEKDIEILIAASGTLVEWIASQDGQVGNVGPYGADGLYVGRAVCPAPENKGTPGKIHPKYKKFFMPCGGEEKEFTHYEALFIRAPTHHWDAWTGVIPPNAVKASDNYYVGRANYDGGFVPGKLHATDRKFYIPYGGKEHEVNTNCEVLIAGPGTKVEWVHSKDGNVPLYTVGPMGKENLYVGRAKCPSPENQDTPGKIHPGYKKLFIPWGGKEVEHTEYEALVIKH